MGSREIKELEIKEVINSGLYSIANLEIFDIVENLVLSENLKLHLEYTTDLINNHLQILSDFSKEKPGLSEYLKAIKETDVKNNHGLENENPVVVEFYSY